MSVFSRNHGRIPIRARALMLSASWLLPELPTQPVFGSRSLRNIRRRSNRLPTIPATNWSHSWRGARLTRNVLLVASFQSGGFHPLDFVMHPISGTDVWHVTVRLPAAARFTYSLSINDPLVFSGPQPQRFATMQADPLNPQRWGCSKDAPLLDCQSIAELPGAAPQPWLVPNNSVASGTVEKLTIHCELLKNDHDLSVYLSAGYKPVGTPYRLVIIFDESAYLTKVP